VRCLKRNKMKDAFYEDVRSSVGVRDGGHVCFSAGRYQCRAINAPGSGVTQYADAASGGCKF